jgi:DNA-binding NarL/FixJ family response regulator
MPSTPDFTPRVAPAADSNTPIRVFITDDHEMARFALTMWIETVANSSFADSTSADSTSTHPSSTNTSAETDGDRAITIVGTSSRGKHTLQVLGGTGVDVLVIDIDLPDMNGLDVIRALRADGFRAGVLTISGSNIATMQDAIDAGANGFVSKEEGHEAFLEAIRWIAANPDETWLSLSAHRQLMNTERSLAKTGLTQAERAVLRLVELSNKEIADKLAIKESTVKNHLWSIYRKLDLPSRVEAIEYAAKIGLIARRAQ